MEFLYPQSRYGASESSLPMRKKVGLLIFNDKPFKESHIVFSTRNLTKSILKMTKIPPKVEALKDNPTIGTLPNPLEKRCLLLSHGLRIRGNTSSSKPDRLEQTINLLPSTVCTKHGTAGFLPLDYVRRMAEYTRTTCKYPSFKVVHSFEDCILKFPHPPPIGSSQEHGSRIDYSRNCYQCFAPLSHRTTICMYRDYLFCCHGCRLKACVTHYWYKKAMKSDNDFDDGAISSTMEREKVTNLVS